MMEGTSRRPAAVNVHPMFFCEPQKTLTVGVRADASVAQGSGAAGTPVRRLALNVEPREDIGHVLL